MHRDLTKQVGGVGKTVKKPAYSATLPLCNICGGNHTMVFPIRIRKCRSNGAMVQLARRGRTDTIATGARVDRVRHARSERFPRKIGDTASGRVCSPVASTCTASKTTLSSVSVDVFDDIVNKSMMLDFQVLPFQSNVGTTSS
jgi:hypothetical protein